MTTPNYLILFVSDFVMNKTSIRYTRPDLLN